MGEWVDVTDHFSEERRHYMDTYMEINEVYDGLVEVSLFSSKDDLWEIYFSFDIFYGIIYVEEKDAYEKREEVKKELLEEYLEYKEPRGDFINSFAKKHKVCMPNNILFNSDKLMKQLMELF